ncbi:hypothetical protein I3760_10G144400 [Carya illinoinensis]|nr:hypothetical protein I3760_10G144400 [Carya illinoinensis]
MKYLGVNIVEGRVAFSYMEDLVNKIRNKVSGWKTRLLSAGGKLILLKHVLLSLPIYLLSVVQVPKSVLNSINRILSNFFWGESDGSPKRKWCAWNKICKPIKEGGLGVRDLEEVQNSLHMKFAWKIITENSLWAQFFRGKYVKGIHLSLLDKTKGTRFWKMIMKQIPHVLERARWKVRDGQISFWFDAWTGTGPLVDSLQLTELPGLKLHDCKLGNEWDIQLLERLVGVQKTEELIEELGKPRQGKDLLVWTPVIDGHFTTRSAWECLRVRSSETPWAAWVWHETLLKKMSIMVWKAWHNSLSVDDRLRRIGIPVVLKCSCCAEGGYEDVNHILYSGNFAQKIWRKYANSFGLPFREYITWKENLNLWFRRASRSSQMGVIMGILPTVITWKLWTRRCRSRMEGYVESMEEVWFVVRLWLMRLLKETSSFRKLANEDKEILSAMNIKILPVKMRQVQVVRWIKPRQGEFKLNTDGCSLNNPGISGAGVFYVMRREI